MKNGKRSQLNYGFASNWSVRGEGFGYPDERLGGGGAEQGRRHGRLRPEVLLNGHQHLQGGTRASPVERLMSFYPPCPSGIVREAQYLPSLPALLPTKQN